MDRNASIYLSVLLLLRRSSRLPLTYCIFSVSTYFLLFSCTSKDLTVHNPPNLFFISSYIHQPMATIVHSR